MEIATLCNFATLAPYTPSGTDPWDEKKVKHLYRRLGFGTSSATVNIGLSLTPDALVDQLLDEAINMPNTPTPVWGYWSFDNYTDYDEQSNEQRSEWYRQANSDILSKNLKGRLAFFWLNHFVTELEVYNHPPYLFQYWDDLQTYCAGNFKDFTLAMSKNPAMLLYLNGFENTKFEPNENYARELYELFTLGENNGYTQEDIIETSRALTGYNDWATYGAAITFNPETFDNTDKTIFGQTGNWGYDEVIDLLFAQKSDLIATYICKKLYTYFVSPEINDDVVAGMATTFLANSFEIAPVLRQLFKSEHFFNEAAQGVLIKSPVDLTFTFLNESGLNYENGAFEMTDLLLYINQLIGQNIFEPVDVAGWQRDKDWINSSTLTGRWLGMEYITWSMWDFDQEQYRQFAIDLTQNSSDPEFIARAIVDYFNTNDLFTTTDYELATDIFKWEVPENYYEDGIWNLQYDSAPYQVILLLQHMFRMPEYQLK